MLSLREILGGVYENGQGVAQDYAEAVKWYPQSGRTGCFRSGKTWADV